MPVKCYVRGVSTIFRGCTLRGIDGVLNYIEAFFGVNMGISPHSSLRSVHLNIGIIRDLSVRPIDVLFGEIGPGGVLLGVLKVLGVTRIFRRSTSLLAGLSCGLNRLSNVVPSNNCVITMGPSGGVFGLINGIIRITTCLRGVLTIGKDSGYLSGGLRGLVLFRVHDIFSFIRLYNMTFGLINVGTFRGASRGTNDLREVLDADTRVIGVMKVLFFDRGGFSFAVEVTA